MSLTTEQLKALADEASAMPLDTQPGAWQDLALRFAEVVRGASRFRGAGPDAANRRLARIADIIEAVDNRCAAVDGPVTPTLTEMTQAELSEIYELAVRALVEREAEAGALPSAPSPEAIDAAMSCWMEGRLLGRPIFVREVVVQALKAAYAVDGEAVDGRAGEGVPAEPCQDVHRVVNGRCENCGQSFPEEAVGPSAPEEPMKVNLTKDWCLEMALREGEQEVGAGHDYLIHEVIEALLRCPLCAERVRAYLAVRGSPEEGSPK